ncbi:MAG: hypothetical protein AAFX87_04535 [Bacteroidota bacterium]
MKNLKYYVLYGMLLLSLSCTDSNEINEVHIPIENQPYAQQVAYTHKHLYKVGRLASQIARNLELRQLLYEEASKKFDGETNVMLEVLIGKAARIGSTIEVGQELIESLDAFKDIDGVNYYPQIYIPNLEQFKRNTVLKTYETLSDPTFVIFAGDESQETFQGYAINAEGTLEEEPGLLVDEDYAENNETWVLSLNETTSDQCAIDELILIDDPFGGEGEKSCLSSGRTDGTSGGSGSGGSGGSGHATPSATITKIVVICHKESWAAGQSEVNILTLVHAFEFSDAELNQYGNGPNEGGQIAKVPRDDVTTFRLIDVNFDVVDCWDDRAPNMPYGSYVIFEYDTWPAKKQDIRWFSGSTDFKEQFRSADDPYDNGTFFKTDYSSVQIDLCIEWEGQYL